MQYLKEMLNSGSLHKSKLNYPKQNRMMILIKKSRIRYKITIINESTKKIKISKIKLS